MMKVLVIDEDHHVRYAISRLLGDHGFEVVTAADGERGLLLFNREAPDIVIIDIVITPETDGIETVARMRGLCPQARIIGLSGSSVSSVLDMSQAVLTLGVHELIRKPVEAEELLHSVGRTRVALVS